MRCPRCHDEYHDDAVTCADCGVALVTDDTPLEPRVDAHLGRFHPIVAARIIPVLRQRRIPFETEPADLTGLLPEVSAPGRPGGATASPFPSSTMTSTADVPLEQTSGNGHGPAPAPTGDQTEPASAAAPEREPVDEIVVRVSGDYRDDLRAELAVNWSDIVGRLPQGEMYDVLRKGGTQPGWFDGPRGAWVDRQGRIQVEVEEDERSADAERMLGPSLAIIGTILVVFGVWDGPSSNELVILTGVGLLATGIFLPR